ncbi:hypothetical protein D9M71_752960 [compost metagenome]
MGAAPRVQANAKHAQCIHTKAHRALGITGVEVKDKALPPFLELRGRSGAAAVVLVEVDVA